MPPTKGPRAQTTGSSSFAPDAFFENWAKDPNALPPQNNDLRTSIISAFNLAQSDNYVYHAIASVTLAQVQEAVNHGAENGMHAWYPDESGSYTAIASPSHLGRYHGLYLHLCVNNLHPKSPDRLLRECEKGLSSRRRSCTSSIETLPPFR
ncbi:MAG: hypothetical protein Q9218_007422 [Villophora microphyllina]